MLTREEKAQIVDEITKLDEDSLGRLDKLLADYEHHAHNYLRNDSLNSAVAAERVAREIRTFLGWKV